MLVKIIHLLVYTILNIFWYTSQYANRSVIFLIKKLIFLCTGPTSAFLHSDVNLELLREELIMDVTGFAIAGQLF